MSAKEDDNFLFQEKLNPIMESIKSLTKLKADYTLDVVLEPLNEINEIVPTVVVTIDKSAIFVESQVNEITDIIDSKMPENPYDENNQITLPQVMIKLNYLQKSVNDLNSERSNLYTDINRLQRKIRSFENYKNIVNDSLTSIEKEISLLAQYGRRESIEILGIPEFIGIDNLEVEVIKILHSIGIYVDSYQIVAVHRLKETNTNNPRSTIVRFLNRKHAFLALYNKNSLRKITGYQNVYIIENLCPLFKSLYQKCLKLKADNM